MNDVQTIEGRRPAAGKRLTIAAHLHRRIVDPRTAGARTAIEMAGFHARWRRLGGD